MVGLQEGLRSAAPVMDLVGFPRREGAFLQGALSLAGLSTANCHGEAMEVREEHPYRLPRVWRFARLK